MNTRNLIKKVAKYKKVFGEDKDVLIIDTDGVKYHINNTESTKTSFIIHIDSQAKAPITCPICKKGKAYWFNEFGTYVCTKCNQSVESQGGFQDSLEFGRQKKRVKREPPIIENLPVPIGKVVYGRKLKIVCRFQNN